MQAQKRSEIDAKYKWKLEDIFADNEAWEAEFAEVEAMLPALSALNGARGAFCKPQFYLPGTGIYS